MDRQAARVSLMLAVLNAALLLLGLACWLRLRSAPAALRIMPVRGLE